MSLNRMKRVTTLGEFIIKNQESFPYATGELSSLLSALRLAAKLVNSEINKAGLIDEIIGKAGNENVQGEEQLKLDVYANQIFIEALEARDLVCGIASEEEESFVAFSDSKKNNGKYVVLIDPLDGSSNIDVNVSIGTIFSIYRRITPVGSPVTLEDFLQPGINQVATGYIIYGSSTMMVYSTGHTVNGFTFDPTIGVFFLSHPNLTIPKVGSIYSINEGNYPYFTPQIRDYIKHVKEVDESSGKPYSSRYIGSFVADFHRNLIKGGIYLYPETSFLPFGKLRLLYECNPLAFIIENAGGKATDGTRRILEIVPDKLHQRSPLYIGSSDMVDEIHSFIHR